MEKFGLIGSSLIYIVGRPLNVTLILIYCLKTGGIKNITISFKLRFRDANINLNRIFWKIKFIKKHFLRIAGMNHCELEQCMVLILDGSSETFCAHIK